MLSKCVVCCVPESELESAEQLETSICCWDPPDLLSVKTQQEKTDTTLTDADFALS